MRRNVRVIKRGERGSTECDDVRAKGMECEFDTAMLMELRFIAGCLLKRGIEMKWTWAARRKLAS